MNKELLEELISRITNSTLEFEADAYKDCEIVNSPRYVWYTRGLLDACWEIRSYYKEQNGERVD